MLHLRCGGAALRQGAGGADHGHQTDHGPACRSKTFARLLVAGVAGHITNINNVLQ